MQTPVGELVVGDLVGADDNVGVAVGAAVSAATHECINPGTPPVVNSGVLTNH